VYRPGGSALNSGQVGAFRAAEYIANRCRNESLPVEAARAGAASAATALLGWMDRCRRATTDWRADRDEFQTRMSRAGAHIRAEDELAGAAAEAWHQAQRVAADGCRAETAADLAEALKNRYLAFAHAVYLDAVLFSVRSGVGSRGSAITLKSDGRAVHRSLGPEWRIAPEDPAFRDKVQESLVMAPGQVSHEWVARRPLPTADAWFETMWAKFRNGEIYGPPAP
jgi:hypothetical protein